MHVVVVEDDNDTAFLLMNRLDKDRRLRAVHIPSPVEAMKEDVWTYHDASHVVGVIDLMMPVRNGVEVARWVREHFPHVALVALTALVGPGGLDERDPANSPHELVREAAEVFDLVLGKPQQGSKLVEALVECARARDGD